MKKPIRIAAGLIACLILISTIYVFQYGKDNRTVNTETLDTGKLAALDALPQNMTLIAEDSKSQLFISAPEGNPIFRIQDKITGYIWESGVAREYYPKKVNKVQSTMLTSVLSMSYTDFEQKSGLVMGGAIGTEITYKKSGEGVKLLFDFLEQDIQVTMEVKLDRGSLVAKIPFSGIRENGKFGLVSLELFPSFEAARVDEDGYVFVPDGCGAIYKFAGRLQNTTLRTWNVYGSEELNLDKMEYNRSRGIYDASIPVFGIKKGSRAFVGIVTKGAEESEVKFAPAGYKFDLYRIHAGMRYRKRYTLKTADNKEITSVNRQLVKNDFEVRYELLTGDRADYSGMACAYRDYLLNSGQLKASNEAGDSIPVGIDFLAGISEDRLLMDRFISMTTFKNVENTLRELKNNGVENVQTILYGWQKGGYERYPGHFPADKALGGARALKSLADYAKEVSYKLYLSDNYIDAYKEVGGFSMHDDVVYGEFDMVATNRKNDRFLFNPLRAKDLLEENLKGRLDRFKISGIAFDKLGNMLYGDYSAERQLSRTAAVDNWKRMIKASADTFGAAAVEGANAYSYSSAGRLYNIPEKSSQYFKFSQDVPFIQMVLHGSVLYSMSPGNLSSDIEETRLKWVEYGSMPSFLLTEKDASELKYTDMSLLFASDLKQWTEYAIKLYKEINTKLKPVAKGKIIKHEKPAEGLIKVTYDNGYAVYVNYLQENAIIDGIEVGAREYTVKSLKGAD